MRVGLRHGVQLTEKELSSIYCVVSGQRRSNASQQVHAGHHIIVVAI